MSTRTLGLLAGMVGSAVGAWWFARHRSQLRQRHRLTPARDHGTVIFHNTPTPLDSEIL